MPNALTEFAIRSTKPPTGGTVTLWDASLKNFGCRISAGGTKSFVVLVDSGKRRTIGRYPIISLAEARAEAKRLLAQKTLGRSFERSIPFDDARTQFIEHCEQTKRPLTTRGYKRLLNTHFR